MSTALRKLVALAAFQVLVLLGWAAHHERVRATAPTFRLALAPVDPYDVLRGRYFILDPQDGNVKIGRDGAVLEAAEVERFLRGEPAYNGPAQVGFCRVGEQERLCALARMDAAPGAGPARFWSRARVTVFHEDTVWRDGQQVPEPGWRVQADLGLERFFLPNRAELPGRENEPGWELEVCHRPGLTPLPKQLWFQGRPVTFD